MKISHHTPFVFLLILSAVELVAAQAQLDERTELYSYGKLTPTMAVIIILLIAALFFMSFFSIYFRHYYRVPDTEVSPSVRVRLRGFVNPVARGVDASVMENFPTFVYSDVKTLGKGELECAICLNEFEDDETLRLLPKCDHVFHMHCIAAWLEAQVTCPVCRANFVEKLAEGGTEPDVDNQQVMVNTEPDVTVPVQEQLVEIDSRRLPVDLKRNKFSRSLTTGHLVVRPGECTDRFTLRLPEDVRKRVIANWKLNRTNSLLVLPKGGKGRPIDRSRARSDRWLYRKMQSFLWRSREDGSIRLGSSSTSTGNVRANVVPNSTGDPVRVDWWAFLRNASFLWRNSSTTSNDDGEGTSVKSTGTYSSSNGSVRLPPV